MEPRQIAQTLMSNFLNGNTGNLIVKCDLDGEDNEFIVQVLLSIYNEMHGIWYEHPDMQEKLFLQILDFSFKILNYKLHIINPREVISINGMSPEDIVHYASILPDGRMLLNPFHPMHIAELIQKEGAELPDSYREMLQNINYLPYIAIYHKYSNGLMDVVYFERLR
jgi:hypothetical protein